VRTINVTGGFSDYAVGTVTETTGKDLSSATFKVALILKSAVTLPASGNAAWQTPNPVVVTAPGTATVSLLVTNSTTPGDYYLWVDVADNPTVVPVKASNELIRVI
jgi:hypothetical protein